MPGVPRSRGCEACRQRKKRCDLGKPSCGRCIKIGISCIGSGVRRYKFQNEAFQVVDGKIVDSPSPSTTTTTAVSPPSSSTTTFTVSPSPAPQSISSPAPRSRSRSSSTRPLLAQQLASILQLEDLAYHMYAYGGFLQDLPQRVGLNPTLDAAVAALIAAFEALRRPEVKVEALSRYGSALTAMRESLQDLDMACTADSMIACYLLQICFDWVGHDGDPNALVFHGGGQIQMFLLRESITRGLISTYSPDLLMAICSNIVLESYTNPTIHLESWFWDVVDQYTLANPVRPGSASTMDLRMLSDIAFLLRRPVGNLDLIRQIYDLLLQDHYEIQEGARKSSFEASSPTATMDTKWRSAMHDVEHGKFLTAAMLLNRVLRSVDGDPTLVHQSFELVDEATSFARRLCLVGPLAAGFGAKTLRPVVATMVENHQAPLAEAVLAECECSFGGPSGQVLWIREGFLRVDAALRYQIDGQIDPALVMVGGGGEQGTGFGGNEASCIIL